MAMNPIWTKMIRLLIPAATMTLPLVAQAQTLTLHTENYPPYQTRTAGGEIGGENSKIIRELMKRAGLKFELKMDTWDKSLQMARTTPDHGVFTTVRTAEREKLFHWVGPISSSRWVLLAKKTRAIRLSHLKDAFAYKIGGYRNDAKTAYIEKAGGKVDVVDDDSHNAVRLNKGEIDLWATGYVSGMMYARDAGITDVEEVLVFHEDYGYLALNLESKPALVLNLNRILDEMKSEGLLTTLKFKN